MPSETFPRATDSNTAPRPLLQAWIKDILGESRDLSLDDPAYLSIVVESYTGLRSIWCLHKDKFVLPNFIQDPLQEPDELMSGFRLSRRKLPTSRTISFQAATIDSMYK